MNWRNYKKVELHRHLEGAIRLESIIEIARKTGVKLPSYNLNELKEHALVTKPLKDLSVVLNRLWLTQSVLSTQDIIERISYENCIDAFNDGITHLELRYSPGFINTNHPDLDFEKIHHAILKGRERALKECPNLKVGYICIISRDLSSKDAEMSAEFAVANKKTFIGFDLAGDEVGYPAENFKHLFNKVKKAGLGITVHSGEAKRPEAAQTVKDAIVHLGAQRIGHGVQVIHDKKIMEFVKSENVLLEVCPTSNYLTQAFATLEEHPIRKLMEFGIKLCVNSDDPNFLEL
ncbi:MAG: adenosine deaminase, partial [Oligoflexia bacterium]|nr:adenosine deaminase [Oligoflexia bacterium]